jgi:hypothetical protein
MAFLPPNIILPLLEKVRLVIKSSSRRLSVGMEMEIGENCRSDEDDAEDAALLEPRLLLLWREDLGDLLDELVVGFGEPRDRGGMVSTGEVAAEEYSLKLRFLNRFMDTPDRKLKLFVNRLCCRGVGVEVSGGGVIARNSVM